MVEDRVMTERCKPTGNDVTVFYRPCNPMNPELSNDAELVHYKPWYHECLPYFGMCL